MGPGGWRGFAVVLALACSCTQGGTGIEETRAELQAARDELRAARDDLLAMKEELEQARRGLVEATELVRARGASSKRASRPLPAELEEVRKSLKCKDDRCTLKRDVADRILANPAPLFGQSRVVPSIEDGATVGFKLYAIRPGSVPALLGLENGDTLKGINGRRLGSPDDALEAYVKLREAKELSIEIERRGKTRTLTLVIE